MPCVGHSHDGESSITTFSLHPHIDHDRSYCLNESVPDSGVQILRPHSKRLLLAPTAVSSDLYDPDEVGEVELLLHVTFTEAVNMSSLCVYGRGSLVELETARDTDDGNNGARRRTAAPWK